MNMNRVSKLLGHQEAILNSKSRLLMGLDEAERLIGLDNDVQMVLKHLQSQFATKTTAVYSELLTAIGKDVLGDRAPEIKLQPTIKGNRPALDIYAVDKGVEMDIADQGGSVSNLIAAGLRFIGLALSTNRRFCLLDEADCWLEGRYSPAFMNVIDKLCAQIGVQALVISHNKDMLDELNMSVAKLQYDEHEKVYCEMTFRNADPHSVDQQLNAELMEGSGLRYIRLENVMSHVDTQIDLDSGLTALVGENHIGKSVVTRAMKALVSNTRSRSLIRQGASSATVTIGLEEGLQLSWTIQANDKGLPKASYLLKDGAGEILHFIKDVTDVPDFVDNYLAMTPSTEGVSLNIGEQRDPLFILNPLISAHKRADLIKLGHEFAKVNGMIKAHQETMVDAKRSRRELSKSLDAENAELARLKPLNMIGGLAHFAEKAEEEAVSAANDMDVIKDFAQQSESSEVDFKQIASLIEADIQLATDEAVLAEFTKSAELWISHKRAFDSINKVEAPCNGDIDLLARYISLAERTSGHSILPIVKAGLGLTVGTEKSAMEEIEQYAGAEQNFTKEYGVMIEDLKLSKKLNEQLKASGNICPTCSQPIASAVKHVH